MRTTRFLMVTLLALTMSLSCANSQDKQSSTTLPDSKQLAVAPQDGELRTITGTIRRVGSEPFSRLVLTDGNGQNWVIDKEWYAIVQQHEQEKITLKARVTVRQLKRADGLALRPQYELSNIEIIN